LQKQINLITFLMK